MNKNRFRVLTRENIFGGLDIYLLEDVYPRVANAQVVKGGHLEWKMVEEGSIFAELTPLLSLGHGMSNGIIKAIVDSVMAYGIRPDAQAKNEGELQATKYHLEDIRHILKIWLEPKVVWRKEAA